MGAPEKVSPPESAMVVALSQGLAVPLLPVQWCSLVIQAPSSSEAPPMLLPSFFSGRSHPFSSAV